MEYLLRFIRVYPFQCQVCAHRFTKYQSSAQRALGRPDRRHYERVTTTMPVDIVGDRGEGEGVVVNLSLDGCSLRTPLKLSAGDRLDLSLYPQDKTTPVRIERAIVRSIKAPLVGIQFVQFPSRSRERLSRVIHKLLTQQGASA